MYNEFGTLKITLAFFFFNFNFLKTNFAFVHRRKNYRFFSLVTNSQFLLGLRIREILIKKTNIDHRLRRETIVWLSMHYRSATKNVRVKQGAFILFLKESTLFSLRLFFFESPYLHRPIAVMHTE